MDDSVALYLKNLSEFNNSVPELVKCNNMEEGKAVVDKLIKINKTALYNYIKKNKEKIKDEIYDYIIDLIGKEYE